MKMFSRMISKSCIFTHLLVRSGWACADPAPGFLHLWLLPSCEISSRSPWFARRVVTNLSDVLRRNFCLHSQRPHVFFLTAASQSFHLARVANFSTLLSPYSCVAMGRKSSVRSACCTLLRMLSEQLWIWCLGKFWSFDDLPKLMLKWIWCDSEGSYDDLYFRKQGATLANFMLCYQRTFCLVFALFLQVATIRMYYCSLEHRRSQGGAKGFMAPQMKQIWRQFRNISLTSWGKRGHIPDTPRTP